MQDDKSASPIIAVAGREKQLRMWLEKTAPECFVEQKHTEEGTQERIYWHHGYMMGLRDALRMFLGEQEPNRNNRTPDKPTESFLA